MVHTILRPNGFDLDSIDKCFADVTAQFIFVEDLDSEIKKREGQHFFVLHKEYFTVYTRHYREGIKCGYQSRNMVMAHNHSFWHQYNLMHPDRYERLKKDGLQLQVIKVDDLFIWKELPLMYFVSKKDIGKINGNGTEDNTIVEYFDELNIEEFAATLKSKINVVEHVFVVYLGNHMYQCFNTDDITVNYKYSVRLKYRVVDMVRKDVNSIKELIKEDEELPKKKAKTERDANFKLVDINGNEIDENKKYFLKVRQTEEWSNDEHDALYFFESQLEGCLSSSDLEVSCEIADGISYILCGDQYLHATDESGMDTIGGSSEVPNKFDRLQFHLTTNNMFKITRWNNHVYALLYWVKASVGVIKFDDSEETVRWDTPTEFYLEKIVQSSS